jgi:nitrite reductase (NADH) large subunit
MSDDDTICYCVGVRRSALIKAIHEDGARTVADLQRKTGAIGGCGTCRWDVEDLLEEELAKLDQQNA